MKALLVLAACLLISAVSGQGLLSDCTGTCDEGLQCCALDENSQKCVPMDMSCEQYAANYASDNSGSQPSSFEDQTDDLPEDATPPQQGDTTQPTQGDTTQQQQSDTTQQQQQQQQQSDNPPQSATGTTPQPDQPPPDSGKGASQGGDTVGVVSPGVLADVASVIVDDVAATNNEITCSTPREDGDGTDPVLDGCPQDLECCTFNAYYHSCQEECFLGNATATLYKRCFSYRVDETGIDLLPDVCQGNTTCQYVNEWYAQCLLNDDMVTSQSV